MIKILKPFTLLTLFFFTSSLDAYDLSVKQDNLLVCEANQTKVLAIPKSVNASESYYEKYLRKLSEYRGSLVTDMLTYSVDMFVPDEMTRAVNDVLTNRQEKGFSTQTRNVPQTIANDSLNVALTSTYYYMQDMARITERMWKNMACNPEFFEYDVNIEPLAVLHLSECDSNARGGLVKMA